MADTSSVQISINVVDANSGAATKQVIKNIETLGTSGTKAGQQLAGGLEQAGTAGQKAGEAIGSGMKSASEHSLSALDNVRLLRDDLGIRVPRAMEKVISQSSTAMTAIGAIGTGLVALGGIQLAISFGTEIYKFYDKLQDVNAEMRKYAQQASVNAEQKLFDTSSIEEADALIRQNTGLLEANTRKKQAAGVGDGNQGSIEQYANRGLVAMGIDSSSLKAPIYGATDDAERARLKANEDLLKSRQRQIENKAAIDRLEAKTAQDAHRLVGSAQAAAAADNAIRKAALDRSQQVTDAQVAHDQKVAANRLIEAQHPKNAWNPEWVHQQDLKEAGWTPVPDVAQDLGTQTQADAVARAKGERSAAAVSQQRREDEEIAQAREAAHAAGLQGEERYQAQLAAIVAGYQRKANTTEIYKSTRDQLISAAKQKFLNEYQERLRTEQAEDRRRFEESAHAGNTGLARMGWSTSWKLVGPVIVWSVVAERCVGSDTTPVVSAGKGRLTWLAGGAPFRPAS